MVLRESQQQMQDALGGDTGKPVPTFRVIFSEEGGPWTGNVVFGFNGFFKEALLPAKQALRL
ncbi:hypothetical protein V513_10440 [Mesotoga sp. H07.pep.5.3]|nr:hypothetical protein V513_10440 [Mesotoga sp. H07.pep.5.3]